MGDVGKQRQANFTAHLASRGESTLINGQSTLALWQQADVGRVQLYLKEEEWGAPCFELRLPAAVWDAPYSIANGVAVVRENLGWKAVVRNCIPEVSDGEIIQVNALVVLTQRP